MSGEPRMVSVIYGYLPSKISRTQSRKFIEAHAAEQGLSVPQEPIARYWCHPAPPDAPAKYAIGWTAPVVPRPTALTTETAQ